MARRTPGAYNCRAGKALSKPAHNLIREPLIANREILALEHHVYWTQPMGAQVLINGTRYKSREVRCGAIFQSTTGLPQSAAARLLATC